MRRLMFLIVIVVFTFIPLPADSQNGDGIPDNCEYTSAAHYRPNVFPRFELQNQRLVLVDWTTGEDVQVIATNVGEGRILAWSADCRYLATAIGTLDSMATVVFDTVTNERMGDVPDARNRPHPITWGFGGYLVVETRSGAILWNVPARTQVLLTTSFNTTTIRNFSRLRWDAANGQLIANLAVGGRVVYDLATGQEVEVAAQAQPTGGENEVIIGGNRYECSTSFSPYSYYASYRDRGVRNVSILFDDSTNAIFLTTYDRETAGSLQSPVFEPLQMLEIAENAAWFQSHGWSPTCRYVVGSIGIAGRDASDTVAWDIVENRRVGVFEDARDFPHPINWNPTLDVLLVETRDGAYLWNLTTDARLLINANVEIAVTGYRSVRSFRLAAWDASGESLYAVPVERQNAVYRYDTHTGEIINQYILNETDQPVNFWFPNGDTILLTESRTWRSEAGVSFNVNTGERVTTPEFQPNRQPRATDQPIPAALAPIDGVSGFSRNSYGSSYYAGYFDLSGDGFSRTSLCAGNSYPTYLQNRDFALVTAYTEDEVVQIIESGINEVGRIYISPECRYIAAEVSIVSNADVPYDDNPVDDTYRERYSETLVFWDAATGERIAEFPHPYRPETYTAVWWSPDGNWAMLRTTAAFWVVHLPERRANVMYARPETLLETYYEGIETYPRAYWDFERGQLLTEGWGGVFVFDLLTGERRYVLTPYPDGRPARSYWGISMEVEGNSVRVGAAGVVDTNSQWTTYDLNTLLPISSFTEPDPYAD